MIVLWTLAAVARTLYIVFQQIWRQVCTLGLHVALLLILIGALTTHLTVIQGRIHLRQSMPPAKTYYMSNDTERVLPFLITLDDFEVEYYEGSNVPKDYVSRILITKKEGDTAVRMVAMNKKFKHKGYRFYQTSGDERITLTCKVASEREAQHYCGMQLTLDSSTLTGGAFYKGGIDGEVWLCPVTLFMLGRYPKHILIYRIHKNNLMCPICFEWHTGESFHTLTPPFHTVE